MGEKGSNTMRRGPSREESKPTARVTQPKEEKRGRNPKRSSDITIQRRKEGRRAKRKPTRARKGAQYRERSGDRAITMKRGKPEGAIRGRTTRKGI